MNNRVYEKVTIDMLRPGVPFYQANPQEDPNARPSYNVNCDLPGSTEVWVIYMTWQSNPHIKKECHVKITGNAAAGLINQFQSDWF